ISSTTNARSEPGLSGVCCSSSGCTSVERRSRDWWCGGYGSPFTAKRTPGPSRTPPCGHPCFSPLSGFGLRIDRRWWIDFGFGLLLGALLIVGIFLTQLAAGWVTVTGALETT